MEACKRQNRAQSDNKDHITKIAALEARIKEQDIKITAIGTTPKELPPPPFKNPLQPPLASHNVDRNDMR